MTPGIAAIIPLYNGAATIEAALRSVFAQTQAPAEIVVVDDGSIDEGPAIVAGLARTHPMRLVRRANGGQSAARNQGVAESSAPLIALLDQDDIWYPDHLAVLGQRFAGVGRLGWAYSDIDEIDAAGALVARAVLRRRSGVHPKQTLADCLRADMHILPSATVISRSAFVEVGGFDERLSGYEDDDLFLRLFWAGYGNIFIDRSLSKWRIHRGSSAFSPRMTESRMIYVRKLWAAFPAERRLIAARFVPAVLADYRNALAGREPHAIASKRADLALLVPYLSWHWRILLPLLRPARLARAALELARRMRRAA